MKEKEKSGDDEMEELDWKNMNVPGFCRLLELVNFRLSVLMSELPEETLFMR